MLGRNRNIWVLLLLMLAGLVIGGFIGEYAGGLSYMAWLNYGQSFGLSSPLVLDLGLLILQFGFTIKFTICGIIGLILSIIIYKRWL